MAVWLELPKQRWSLQSRLAGRKTDIIMELFDMHTDMLTHTHTEAPDTPSWCRPCTSQGAAGTRWRQKHITAERLRSQRPLSPLYSTQHCSPPAETQKNTELGELCVCVSECAWIYLCEGEKKRAIFCLFIQNLSNRDINVASANTLKGKQCIIWKLPRLCGDIIIFMREKILLCLFLILVCPCNYIEYNVILKNWCFECLVTMARLVTCNLSLFLSHWYFAKGIDGLISTNWCFFVMIMFF